MAKNEKQIILTYVGRDSWSRPVYIHEGVYWVDVEPRKDRKPMLCTKITICRRALRSSLSRPVTPGIEE